MLGTNGPIQSPTLVMDLLFLIPIIMITVVRLEILEPGQYPCNDILGGTPTGHVGTLTTDSIDCSMYSDVTMVFNSFYREYTGI